MNHITILKFLNRGNKTFFDVSSTEQKVFLDSFPEPVDDWARSFYQYKCQSFFAPKWKAVLLNIISFLLFFPVLLFYLFNRLADKEKGKYDAISDLYYMKEVIPEEVSNRHIITFLAEKHIGSLSVSDILPLLRVFVRCLPEFYFSLKIMVRTARYSQLIKMYSPSIIIAHHEYSFTSSFLTAFCHSKKVQHINIMHGEKLFNIVDAFFRFDKCYVWSEHYVRLLKELRAESSQFVISLPPSMKIDLAAHKNEAVWADYKYYLASFSESQIKGIVDSLSFVVKTGKTVKYRIHPRNQNLDLLMKYVKSDDIEYPNEVSIVDSIANCEYVVGSYSTVLSQAFCSGRSVLLDDVTFKNQYDRLADLRYWLIGENCPRLSEMQ